MPNDLWQELRTAGLQRVRLAGRTYSIDSPPRLAVNATNDLQVIIDRVVIKSENRSRIAESVELALSRGAGVMFAIEPDDAADEPLWNVVRHSQHLACRNCGLSLEPLTPHSFSFNTPLGWCQTCEGLGTQSGTDPALLMDFGKSVLDGGLRHFPAGFSGIAFEMITAMAKSLALPLDKSLDRLNANQRRALFHGTGERWYKIETGRHTGLQFQWHGLMPALEHATRVSPQLRAALGPHVADVPCPACDGSRLASGAAAAKFRGLTMGDIVRQPLSDLHATLKSWKLDQREQQIAGEVLEQLLARTEFLLDVGLEYISLSRAANTLSGGESQRIRLASQLGSGLCGVLYVLDEPTIGLHPRDNSRLLRALTKLRDLGNTLITVEHDREVIAGSDMLLDFGPGAGRFGGQLVAQGTPKQVANAKGSVTGPYLSGKASIPIPSNRRSVVGPKLSLRGARAHTLREVDVDIPLGTLTVVTGPSGSGKSTLINEILYPGLSRRALTSKAGSYRMLDGLTNIAKVIRVDQTPLGHNPSSTPATYTGVFELIRQLYSQLPQARARGFTARQFSFNVPGGRCEKCEGFGQLRIEMHFLPDVWVTCDSCHGKRFTEDTLSVKYHEYSIHDMLEMQIGKALEVLSNIPKIRRILKTLVDVGLDYVSLGQPATTLSGGEAQRVKLAAELARPDTGRSLYLLDEPTTGLHFSDVSKLLTVLHRLVDIGNTVVVIEHNLDVIKSADWVIDMGPEAGWGGGKVVACGTPEVIVQHALRERAIANGTVAPTESLVAKPKRSRKRATPEQAAEEALNPASVSADPNAGLLRSYTGEALANVLSAGPYEERPRFDPFASDAPVEGDVELDAIGRDTLLPWQANGKQWHLQDSTDRAGKPIRWDRKILEQVIDRIEKHGGFSNVNWTNRSIVEVTSPMKSKGWFLHAITGETWLLKLKFRTPRKAFTKEQLLAILDLPTLNQLDEVESYGNDSRLKVKQAGPFLELEIRAYTFEEMNQSSFWEWLTQAMDAFLMGTGPDNDETSTGSVQDHMPWKVLGQRWHTLRKGFPPNRDIVWPAEAISVLVQTMHQVAKDGRWRWDEQTFASFIVPEFGEPWVTVYTKRPEGLVVVINGHNLDKLKDMYSQLPVTPQLTSRSGLQQLQMAFTELQQPRDPAFKKLLESHYMAMSAIMRG